MGQHFVTDRERIAWQKEANHRMETAMAKRLNLADKVVMVIVDKIVAELLRPGPVAEERECYEMAQELRDMIPKIKILVAEVLRTEGVSLS